MLNIRVDLAALQLFLLVVFRLAAMMLVAPPLEGRNIPGIAKIGLALAVGVLVFPSLSGAPPPLVSNPVSLGIGVAAEVMLGAACGLLIRLSFAAVQIAGQLAGFQMGFAIANVMDPVTSTQLSVSAQVLNLFAMTAFLVLDFHHWVIRAAVASFELAPPLGFGFSPRAARLLDAAAAQMFEMALRVGAPVIVSLLLTSVAFGLMARTVPQMNVFFVAMPIKILVGFFFMALSFRYLWPTFHVMFRLMAGHLMALLKTMG